MESLGRLVSCSVDPSPIVSGWHAGRVPLLPSRNFFRPRISPVPESTWCRKASSRLNRPGVSGRLQLSREWSQGEESTPLNSPEARERTVRMLVDHGGECPLQYEAIRSIAARIGGSGETWRQWVRQAGREHGRRGHRSIQGGRAPPRRTLSIPALSAIRFDPDPIARPRRSSRYEALVKAGKPAKVALTATMRTLLILADAPLRNQRHWTAKPA